MIEVEFDPAKDALNRRKHGISLSRAAKFDFDDCLYIVDDSQDYGEVRLIAIGFLGDTLHTLVFSPRGEDAVRAIGLRNPLQPKWTDMAKKIGKAENSDSAVSPEMLARARRREQLPPDIQALLPRRRGLQHSPVKVPVTIRLSRDVVEALRSTGTGWQTRADEMLRQAVERLPGHAPSK